MMEIVIDSKCTLVPLYNMILYEMSMRSSNAIVPCYRLYIDLIYEEHYFNTKSTMQSVHGRLVLMLQQHKDMIILGTTTCKKAASYCICTEQMTLAEYLID